MPVNGLPKQKMNENDTKKAIDDGTKEVQEPGIDIVKSFHEQFAQNQNHHQALFVQALAVLVTVLVGFGYVYIRAKVPPQKSEASVVPTVAKFNVTTAAGLKAIAQNITSSSPASNSIQRVSEVIPQTQSPTPEVNVTVEMLYGFLALACLLLSFGIALISNMALGFRRDQTVAANIRVLWGVMPQPKYPQEDRHFKGVDYFPSSFNPVDKKRFFFWMPEFHQIFLGTLFFVKIIVVLSVWVHPEFSKLVWPISNLRCFTFLMVFVVIGTFLFDGKIVLWYWKKWRETASQAPERLRSRLV